MTSARETPLMRQYLAVKAQYPDALLFFRMGDFYELFLEDAERAAPLLDITLTSRDKGKPDAVPMCGVPVHSVEGYVKKLTSLELVAGMIGNKGARAIADAPGLSSLKTLRLRGNKISGAGAAALAASPHLRGLEFLDLTNNVIDNKGEEKLRQAFGPRVDLGWR